MKNFIKHTKSWNFLPYCAFRIAIIDNCFPSLCVFDDYWPSIAMSTLLAIICSSCACIQAAIYRFLVKWLAFVITTGSMLLYFQLVWNTFLIPSFSSRSLLLSLLKRRPSEHEIFSPRRMRQKSMTNFPPAPDNTFLEEFSLVLMPLYKCIGKWPEVNMFDDFERFLREWDVTFPCKFNSKR